MESVPIKTSARTELVNITSDIREAIRKNKWLNGFLCVYIPHTTSAVTINEQADPDVARDMLEYLNKIVPFNGNYHHSEGNSAAHIKASLVGSSVTLIVENGQMALGTWQGVFFCEFDGPRNRKYYLDFVSKD